MKQCVRCKKELGIFALSYKCHRCGRVYCSHCIKNVDFEDSSVKHLMKMDNRIMPEYSLVKLGYVLCPECAKDFQNEIKFANKAIRHSGSVELVSKNYLGKKKHGEGGKRITSDWHRDKDECRKELKRLAALNSYSIVMDVETESDVMEDGNYKYRVFRMTGRAYYK